MFPKTERLPKKLFDEVFSSGRSFHTTFFNVRYLKSNSVRVAVVVSKKVATGAVKRHFLKRRIFNCLNTIKQDFPVGSYILFLKKKDGNYSREDISNDLEEIVNKVVNIN